MKALFVLLGILFSWTISAETEHRLIRRVTVFPVLAPAELREEADKLWWELRATLTKDQRFLVASKNFLIQKDVFQPRSELGPSDVIILGKVLDAHALMTTELKDKTLHMRVYDGEFGRPLWMRSLQLQPSIPLKNQLQSSTEKLARDFLASFPYQGFVVKDVLKNEVVFREGSALSLKAEVGQDAQVEIGDQVQVIRILSDSLKPLFTEGARIEVVAEGRVMTVNKTGLQVDLDRSIDPRLVIEGALVRIPKEMKRLREAYALDQSLRAPVDPEFLSPRMMEHKRREAEKKPLMTSLTFIANIAAFLLLAF